MESLQNSKVVRACKGALPYTLDALFALWLVTETAYAHTTLSRAVLLLFCMAVVLWAVLEQKAFLSPWMGFALFMLLWSVVGASAFALDAAASKDAVKTLVVCLLFSVCAYQYFLLRRDFPAVFNAFMAGVLVLIVIVTVRSWPLDFVDENYRLGNLAGVNPNIIGMLAAYGLAMAFDRVLHGKPVWLLACLFFTAAILMAKSTKAYGMAAAFFIALLLIRFPKRWWLKLILLSAAFYAAFRLLALWDWADHLFFHKLRFLYENLFENGYNPTSFDERTRLASVGLEAFRRRPWTGYGLDGYRFLAGSQDTYSHNNYIELLVSGGIPLLALYYAPQLLGLLRGLRQRKAPGLPFLLLLAATQMVMDIGMVAYLDRTALVIPLLLYAGTRLAKNKEGDGDAVFRFLKNPCVLVRWCSTRGLLNWMPDRPYLKLLYRGCTGKQLHLDPPVTMNEKLQWTKLYDRNPLYPSIVDKLAVRDYVKEKGCEQFLVPLLGTWERAEDIDFSALPDRFVLKCAHDSGGVRICSDRATFDEAEARAFLARRLKKSYYPAGREWPYRDVKPRILAEAFIGDASGKAPDDVKLYCFSGRAEVVMLCKNRTAAGAEYYYFDRDFRLLPIGETTKRALAEGRAFEKPAHLPELITLAETLSQGFPALRVDLYDTNGRVYFGELTLFDQSGFATDTGDDGDALLGSFFVLPEANA